MITRKWMTLAANNRLHSALLFNTIRLNALSVDDSLKSCLYILGTTFMSPNGPCARSKVGWLWTKSIQCTPSSTHLHDHKVHRQRCGYFTFECNLVAELSFDRLSWITLIVIDTSLDDPLQIEGQESIGLVEQFVNVLIRSIRAELQIVQSDLLVWQQIEQRIKRFLFLLVGFFLSSQIAHDIFARFGRVLTRGSMKFYKSKAWYALQLLWSSPNHFRGTVLSKGSLLRHIDTQQFVLRKCLQYACPTVSAEVPDCRIDTLQAVHTLPSPQPDCENTNPWRWHIDSWDRWLFHRESGHRLANGWSIRHTSNDHSCTAKTKSTIKLEFLTTIYNQCTDLLIKYKCRLVGGNRKQILESTRFQLYCSFHNNSSSTTS